MAIEGRNTETPITMESTSKRPLARLAEPDFHDVLERLFDKVRRADPEHKVISVADIDMLPQIFNRVLWLAERMLAYECTLMGLVSGLNTVDIRKILDKRSDVLYYLFSSANKDLSNSELIERIKGEQVGENEIRVTYESKEKFDPIELVSQFLKQLDGHKRAVQEYDAEPQMLRQSETRDGPKRFINSEWIEWFIRKNVPGCTRDDAIAYAAERVKFNMFGSTERLPADVTFSIDSGMRDPEIVIKQTTTRAI